MSNSNHMIKYLAYSIPKAAQPSRYRNAADLHDLGACWSEAVTGYRQRYGREPATVTARAGTPIPPMAGVDIERDNTTPINAWYFEIPT